MPISRGALPTATDALLSHHTDTVQTPRSIALREHYTDRALAKNKAVVRL